MSVNTTKGNFDFYNLKSNLRINYNYPMPSSYCNINNNSNIDVDKSTTSGKCIQKTGGGDCAAPADQACYYSYMLGKSREKLDSDLQEIHRPETSRAYTFQSNLETTMLTGIVWAMLGTTVLYYAFTKI